MKSRDLIFIAVVVFVVGGLYFLSTRSKIAPKMPATAEHQSSANREQCLHCHTADKLEALERAHKHPNKWRDVRISCQQCHQAPSGSAAPEKLSMLKLSMLRTGHR